MILAGSSGEVQDWFKMLHDIGPQFEAGRLLLSCAGRVVSSHGEGTPEFKGSVPQVQA